MGWDSGAVISAAFPGAVYIEFACSTCACMASLQVLQLTDMYTLA